MGSTIVRLHRIGSLPHEIVRQVAALDECKGREALFRSRQPEILEALRETARIQSTEASNAIEGIHAPTARIRAILAGDTPRSRPEAEIAGYRSALDLIHASAIDIPLSVSTVLQLHAMLMAPAQLPGGRFKTTDNVIEERHGDGSRNIRFTPTPAWQTEMAMRDLHGSLARERESGALHPVVLLAGYVLDFLCVHPFSDGNGRMSRLLTLLALYHAGYGVGRYISIERLIADSGDTYYDALGASSRGWHDGVNDPIPWLSFFLGVVVDAYRRLEAGIALVPTTRGGKSQAVATFIRSRIQSTFTIDDVREAVPTASDATIRKVLQSMKTSGEIEPTGRGRAAAWRRLS